MKTFLRQALSTIESEKRFSEFRENMLAKLGADFLKSNKLEEAIAIFKVNAKAHPDSCRVYNCLAEAYLKAGSIRKARRFLEKALRLNPEHAAALNMLAKIEGKTFA